MCHETHLLAHITAETFTGVRKTDRINKTCPLGHKVNLVAPNGNNNNNNNNNIAGANMLDSSDEEDELELDYEMSDEEYDLYYHDELFVEYNSYPTLKQVHTPDLALITLLIYDSIQGQLVERPLVILLNSSSSGSLINKRAIPKGDVPTKSNKSHITTTALGFFDTSLTIGLKNIRLPEFSNGRKINGWNCCILFNSTACQYNMILGRDFMQHISINNFFSTDIIQWID